MTGLSFLDLRTMIFCVNYPVRIKLPMRKKVNDKGYFHARSGSDLAHKLRSFVYHDRLLVCPDPAELCFD